MQRSKSKDSLADKADASNKAKKLRQYVHSALTSRVKGPQSLAYNNFGKELQALRRKLETGHDDAAEFSLVCLIQALTACVSSLKEGVHDAVLTTVLSIGLWNCSRAVREAVLELTVELVVASSTFIPNCMQVLIFNLLPPPGSPPLQHDERGAAWTVPPLAVEVQAQVVDAIEKAIQLVPALPTRLLPMLVQNIPHKLRDRTSQCLFLRGVLLLAEGKVGAPLREGLLLGVVEHLLSIDADIKWEEIVDAPTGYDHEEGGSSDDEQDDIFELEGMSDLHIHGQHAQHAAHHAQHAAEQLAALQDGFHDPDAFAAQQQQHGLKRLQQQLQQATVGVDGAVAKKGRPPVDETADKLDSLMEMTFQHLQRRVDAGQLGAVWQTMLTAFERTLLHAHRCKFTQYLIFFLALKDPQRCCSSFSACLMSTLRDARQPPITRSAAAAYLASFLARCGPAPRELVVDVMQRLAAISQEYAAGVVQQQQGGAGGFGQRSSSNGGLVLLKSSSSNSSNGALAVVQRHQAFYAMVQALLYLLCYHMQPLLNPDQHHGQQLTAAVADLVRQQVLPLLSHPLAPLAVCHQAVTHEFVRQALLLGLADDSWEAAAVEAVSQHQAAVAAATAAAAAVVVGGEAADAAANGTSKVLRPLEVFFPFDPYLLQRSSRFLELPSTYICFSNGHPHVAGALVAAGEGGEAADGDDVHSGSDSEPDDSGSGSDEEVGSDDSSSTTSEDPDAEEVEQVAESGPKSGAARRAASGQRPRAGVVPLGLAAAAAAAAAGGRQGVLSGSSPPADMIISTSLVAAPYMAGVSFSPGDAAMVARIAGSSPYGMSPVLGGSPMPMSFTPYEGYMQNVPAQLNAGH